MLTLIDGEWVYEIVDDYLMIRKDDFNESYELEWNKASANPHDEYKRIFQSGSRALIFGHCKDENETWFPLLEKAYAKIHGDYCSLDAGILRYLGLVPNLVDTLTTSEVRV